MYIAPIKPLLLQAASFSTARRRFSSLRRWVTTVFHNILRFRMRLQTPLDSASITLMLLSVKLFLYQNCYQFRTSTLTYVRVGAPYPSGYSPPLLCSASLSALALVYTLSVALLRSFSLLLLSFAGYASPSVFSRSYYAIFSTVLRKIQVSRSLSLKKI